MGTYSRQRNPIRNFHHRWTRAAERGTLDISSSVAVHYDGNHKVHGRIGDL